MIEFDFKQNYTLENDFVRLTLLETLHIPFLELLSRDPEIWTYFLEKGQGGQQFETYIKRALVQHTLHKEYPFVVYDKQRQQYAGMTRFYDYSDELSTIKLGHTWYGKDFRGTGINKHCKYLLFEFAFEKLCIRRIGFGAHASNKISLAAMKSVGCQTEGALRNFLPSLDGKGRADCVLLSILKAEWEESIKEKLSGKIKLQKS